MSLTALLALFWRTRIGQLVALVGAVLLAVWAFAARMKSAGRQQERERQTEATLQTIKNRQELDDEISRLPRDDVRGRLARWVRK